MSRRARISPSRSAPSPSASGPRCASSASDGLGGQHPHAGALLRAGLGQHELPPPSKRGGTQASSVPSRPARRYCSARRSSGGSPGRARRRRSGTGAACRGVDALEAPLPRAPTAAGRTSSASRRAPALPSRSGTPTRARRAPAARLHLRQLGHRTSPAAVDPIRVAVRRGDVVESMHRVHAVAVQDGASSPRRATRARSASSARPRSRSRRCRSSGRATTSTDAELAIASASHRAEPAQLEAVRALLAKAPGDRGRSRVRPQEGRGPTAVATTAPASTPGCSPSAGREAGRSEGYRLGEHPLQQALLARSPAPPS